MLTRKLMGMSALCAMGLLLKTATLPEGWTLQKSSSQNPSSTRSHSSLHPLAGVLPNPETSSQSASDSEFPILRDPLLSSLLLPLPPLLLPDLLLPPLDIPSFNSQRLDEELQLYSRYLRIYGTPDVLLIGSSRSLQGIDPIALQEGLEAEGYAGVKVFNFGVNGATAQVVSLVLQEVLNPEHLPKLIIWGDGLRAFNDGRPDQTYSEILKSEGYRWLQAGNRPIPVRTFYRDAPVLTASANNASLARSALARSTQQVSSVLDMYGFQAVSDRFEPSTYFQNYPRVSGHYDADYVPFGLGGIQTQATIAVAQYAKARNIPLVIVNLPLTQAYMDTPRLRREQAFHQHMQRLAQQEQFIFRDLVQHPTLMQNQFFADPSHINHSGARAVALHLATDPAIPWQVLSQD